MLQNAYFLAKSRLRYSRERARQKLQQLANFYIGKVLYEVDALRQALDALGAHVEVRAAEIRADATAAAAKEVSESGRQAERS